MFRVYFFTAATVLAGLALGSVAAIAQQTPMSVVHQQASLAKDPAGCDKALERAADDVRSRGKDYSPLVNAWLQTAENAAENGDEQACWYWYDRAQNMAR